MTLYDVVGVATTASTDALHAAYRARARSLHPDVHRSGSEDEQRAAESSMQELNAAWAVLSDPERRLAYDRSLIQPVADEPPVVEWVPPEDDVVFDSPGVARLARAIPFVVVLALLVGIFVFTAFAVNEPDESPSDRSDAVVGECVRVQEGQVTAIVACGVPNDGEVVRVIGREQPCPTGEQRVEAANGSQALCTAPAR